MPLTISQTITLDMSDPNYNNSDSQIIHAVQGEYYSRAVLATLKNNGVSYTIPAGAIPVIRYRRSDSAVGWYNYDPTGHQVVNKSDTDEVTFTLSQGLCAVSGRVRCNLDFYSSDNGQMLSTFPFHVMVEKSASMVDLSSVIDNGVDGIQGILKGIIENIYTPISEFDPTYEGVYVDNSLSISGAVPDAARVGEILSDQTAEINTAVATMNNTLDTQDEKIDDMVLIQSEQPNKQYNKIWIDSDDSIETEVPEMTDIVPDFLTNQTYSYGDYVNRQGHFYKYISETPSSGSWHDSKWERVIALNELSNAVSTFASKADQTDLDALTAVVNTKANQSDLNALAGVVDTKADQTDLDALTEVVNTKANQSNLNSLALVVNTKADQTDLDALTTVVDTKASQTEVDDLKSAVSNFEIITTNANFARETIDETETEDVNKLVKLSGTYKKGNIYNLDFVFNNVIWKSNNIEFIQIRSYSANSISSSYVVDNIRASTEVVDGNQLRVTYSPTTDNVKMIGCILYLGAGAQDIEINVAETYSPIADDLDDLKIQAENIAPLVDVSENVFTGTVSGSYAVMYVRYNFYRGNTYKLNLVCNLGTEEVNNCLRINTSLVQNIGTSYKLDIINDAESINPICGRINTFGTGDTIIEEFVATQDAKYLAIVYYGKADTNYQHEIIIGRIASIKQIDQIVLGRSIVDQNKDVEPYVLQFGREISAQTTAHSINRLNFLFFSDIHAKSDLWNRICDYMDEYSDIIPFAIHAGDYVSNDLSASSVVDLYGIRKPKNGAILNTVGNHDCYPAGDNSPTAPIADVYGAIYASVNPATDGWDCVFGSEQYCMYWYKDVAESKIRIVCIDQYHWTNDQATFVANTLSGAITNEYAVITVTHTPITTTVTDIGSGFWTLDNWIVRDTYDGSMVDIRAAINTFINNGGNHIVHLCGHIHSDQIGTLTDDGILQIRIQTASAGTVNAAIWTDTNRVFGTKTYDCFDIMQIDQNLGMLKLVRIGCNSSDCLQPRTTLCWDYVNKRLIANK